jgi:hypothetical protein
MEPPKPRPLTLPTHVLAYLGEYMKMYESGVKKIIYQTVKSNHRMGAEPPNHKPPNIQKREAPSPAGR